MRATELFTIGYEKRHLDELLGLLSAAHVTMVVDVRELPLSRVRGFSKSPLGAALHAAGIRYVHMREAGNPYRHDDPARVLARYRDHLKLDVVEHVAAAVKGERAALLCYERDPAHCHRSILARRVARRLDVVIHDL